MNRIAVLIVAGGRGERAGGALPKQYQLLLGRAVLAWTLDAFRKLDATTQIVIGAGDAERYHAVINNRTALAPVPGGANRQASVLAGLEALAVHAPDFVLIHDAARPLVSAALIDTLAQALKEGAAAVLPVLPVTDAIKRRSIDNIWTNESRDGLFRAQTPQGFHFRAILDAHRTYQGTAMPDDIAIAEAAGMKITAVAGEERNIKITSPNDFLLAETLLRGLAGETRTGSGFDTHRFTQGDHLWLCGLKIPHTSGLEGHSDADVALHALTDAILGAVSAGDIGQHFPPSDARWRGAASESFLRYAADLVAERGGVIVHTDVTVICEAPKIGPHRDAMRARVAAILGLDIARVSVKATTTEGMGFAGRREGIAAQAIATIRLPPH